MNYAIIIVPGSTVIEQNAITRFFADASRFSYWHWGLDTWLVTSSTEQLNPGSLRDTLKNFIPGRVVVLTVQPATGPNWATYGPKEWIEWFTKCWDIKDVERP